MPRDHTSEDPAAKPSSESVLAAVERAERHRNRPTPGVPIVDVADHLGISRHASRRIRLHLEALQAAGALAAARHDHIRLWVLTGTGRRRLGQARRHGKLPVLPESPQHRRWRDARSQAEQEIGRLYQEVRDGINEAAKLLDLDPPAHSDTWFALAKYLPKAMWCLGSATHITNEWPEPNDAHPDVDELHDHGDDDLPVQEQMTRRWLRIGRRVLSL